MRKSISLLMALFMLLLTTTPAFAWGNDGHETVGEIAAHARSGDTNPARPINA
jgi:hypothetical protein